MIIGGKVIKRLRFSSESSRNYPKVVNGEKIEKQEECSFRTTLKPM